MKRIVLAIAAVCAMANAAEIPLAEHPRPDFERPQWVNLNGEWDFTFDTKGEKFDRKIRVPFSWTCKESGIEDAKPNVGWYRRKIHVPKEWEGQRVFMVIGASEWETAVWVDGQFLDTHQGGFTPFEVELTPFVKYGGEHEIKVCAVDEKFRRPGGLEFGRGSNRLYGKQGYGDVKGIWQTVYLEARGETFFRKVHFIPDIDAGKVKARITLASPAKAPLTASIAFKEEDLKEKTVKAEFAKGEIEREIDIGLPDAKLWSPESPYLYEVKAKLEGNGVSDEVATYFGMRKFGVGKMPGTGYPYVTLNNKPYYLKLCLDQAYCPTGFYTYPSDAFMKRDIEISKKLGLNGNRIHIKVEIPRRLYWADKLGLLIMADVPNAWGDAAEAFFREHEYTFREMLDRDMNHPSIFSWVLFNETWGLKTTIKNPEEKGPKWKYLPATQRRVAQSYFLAKKLDPTRLVEDNSPCNRDHVITDINTWHCYTEGNSWERTLRNYDKSTFPGSTQNYIGGYSQNSEPMLNSECGAVWGYLGGGWGMVGDFDWSWDYHKMLDAYRRHPRCCGFLYTEHHDVINEWNGYVRYDRSEKYTGIEELCPGMTVADWHADAYLAVEDKLYRVFEPGEEWEIPVFLSLVTDEFAGKKLELSGGIIWLDSRGNRKEMPLPAPSSSFVAETWQHGVVAKPKIALPGEAAAGSVWFHLKDGGKTIARNFTCFAVRKKGGAAAVENLGGEIAVRRRAGDYSDASFSAKKWKVLDGLKVCGAGTGYFEYEFAVPEGADLSKGAEFVAEVSSKRLNGRDRETVDEKKIDLDYMLGGGSKDGSAPKNSYPMTGEYPLAGSVTVLVNGEKVGETALPDDPADHRGIIAWGEQPEVRIHESGSYGYPVKVSIPGDALKKSADGKVRVRLESAPLKGLAVFGERFGRYPLEPTVFFKK